MKILIVDIGSNSIRSMEAETAAGGFGFFDKHVYTTRLAEGLLGSGRLQAAAVKRSLDTLQSIGLYASDRQLPVYAYATSAVRDAENRDALLIPARALLNAPVDVLTGAQEAAYAYRGATGGTGGLIDIGGGSTQAIAGAFKSSWPVGCVRAKDYCGEQSDFDTLLAGLSPLLNTVFQFPPLDVPVWTGVGGTITTLAALSLGLTRYDCAAVGKAVIDLGALPRLLRSLAKQGDRRREHPLLRDRYDVILQGGAILLHLMTALSIERLRVSDADGMEGYAMHAFEDSIQ